MLTDFLDKSLSVQSRSTAQDSVGSVTSVWVGRLTNVACSVWAASAKTADKYARVNLKADYEIATATDIAATANDRIVVDGRTHTVSGYERFENASFDLPVYVTVTTLVNQ
jgi:hypothetical protein